MNTKYASIAFAGVAWLCPLTSSHATLRVWSGAVSHDGSWANPGNWALNVAPVAGDDLQFPYDGSHPNANNDYAAGTTFNSITFWHGGTGTPGTSYNLGGNSISLNAGVSAVNSSTIAWANAINNPLTLNSNQTFATGLFTSLTFFGAMNLNGHTATIDTDSATTIDVRALISGAGGFIKTNSGTLTVYSNNTYTGSTTLSGGTLQLLNGAPNSAMILNSGTLAALGTVGSITSIGAGSPGSIVINPGGYTAILTCSNVTLNAATTLVADLNGTTSGSYDQLNVHGAVALNNATLSVTLGPNFTPALGDSFVIIANDGSDAVTGTFNGLPPGATVTNGANVFAISYAGGDGNDVALTCIVSPNTVTTTADSGPGSLRAVLASAASGSTIAFALNTPATITLTSGELLVNKNVTIRGPGANLLAVNGNLLGSVFHITNNVAVLISGLTITNGNGSANSGGGVYNDHSTLTLRNCAVTRNLYGGIHNNGEFGSAWMAIDQSTVSGNSYNGSGGGGIVNDGFSGTALMTITASTITGNIASGNGGGINNYGAGTGGLATLQLYGCTLSSNVNGGIFNNGGSGGTATLEIADTILSSNTTANIVNSPGVVISDGYNLSSDNGGGFLTNVTDQINTDPKLGPLADNGGPTKTVALLWGSPAIDKGKSFGLTTDQRGLPRPHDFSSITNASGGDGSDIGAFEFIPPAPILSIIALSNNTIQLQGVGLSNLMYTIQANTNLNPTNWQIVATPSANSNGDFSYSASSALIPTRLYRAVAP